MKPNDSIADLQSKANARLKTYKALAQLYHISTGEEISGETLYFKLLKLEEMAHKFAEDLCNIDMPESIKDKTRELIETSVLSLFSHRLKDFHLNLDPRGYSLKISSDRTQELASLGIHLDRDWGGYGILAPDHR